MNHGLRGLLDWLLPPRCAGCAAVLSDTGGLCGACEAGLGTPAPIPVGPPLASCTAAADFGGAVEDWIHRFKYPPPGLAGFDAAPLAAVRHLVLLAGARAPGPPPDLLVPIPLHPRRLRARGFNPAALLARALARERRLAWDPTALRRLRDTASQTGLGRGARRSNVRGAFAVRRVPPQRIWLVDDVVTTGATLASAARELRRAGAAEVHAICAARTPSARRPPSPPAPRAGVSDRRVS